MKGFQCASSGIDVNEACVTRDEGKKFLSLTIFLNNVLSAQYARHLRQDMNSAFERERGMLANTLLVRLQW